MCHRLVAESLSPGPPVNLWAGKLRGEVRAVFVMMVWAKP